MKRRDEELPIGDRPQGDGLGVPRGLLIAAPISLVLWALIISAVVGLIRWVR